MSVTVFDDGFICMTARYVKAMKEKGGTLYYFRRIPQDVRAHFPGKTFRKVSLGTTDLAKAVKKAAPLIAKDEALWKSLRSSEGMTTRETRDAAAAILERLGLEPGSARLEYPHHELTPIEELNDYFEQRYGEAFSRARYEDDDVAVKRLLNPAEREAVRLVREDPAGCQRLLSDARDVYLANHRKGNQTKFANGVRFAIDQVIDAVGDLPLQSYRRPDAYKVRDYLLARKTTTTTVRRRLNDINSVFNSGLKEFDLKATKTNPFEDLGIPNEEGDATKREGFSKAELATIAAACIETDDDIRHIAAINADTGARLGEVVGLRIGDVTLDGDLPHLHFRRHLHLGRTLKNDQSERKVPLLGLALWGATRALQVARERGEVEGWLFPRYAADNDIRKEHASNTLNKWLKTKLRIGKTTHSFRHAMQTRLKHVGVPKEYRDAIGGWGTRTVSDTYGDDYLLSLLREHLAKVIFWES
jgi:integrase